jgi:hypothetical protein
MAHRILVRHPSKRVISLADLGNIAKSSQLKLAQTALERSLSYNRLGENKQLETITLLQSIRKD